MRQGLCVVFLINFFSAFGQINNEYKDHNGATVDRSAAAFTITGRKDGQGRFVDSVKTFFTDSHQLHVREFRDKWGSRTGLRLVYEKNGSLSARMKYEKRFGQNALQRKDSVEEMILYFADATGRALVNAGEGMVDGVLDFLPERGRVHHGHRDSVWTIWHHNGKISAYESWQDGQFVDGVSYDSLGNEYFYRQSFVPPTPTYGYQEFYRESSAALVYPRIAQRRSIQGKVILKFVVEEDGQVVNPEVVSGLGFGCDEEAMKLLKSSAPWLPARERGQAVRHQMVLPIVFKLK